MDYKQITAPIESVNEEAITKTCQELLQTASYTGQEQEAANLLMETMLALGYDRAWIDGVGNVIGEIRGTHPGPKIVFGGHLDTIPVSGSEGWRHDPFDGEIEDGRIYGRGAVGMKGALAAMVHGLAPLVKQKDKLSGSLFVSGAIGKEQFEGLAFRQVMQVIKPDYVIIGEASDLNISCGQQGRAQIVVTTLGKAAHSAVSSGGKNAAYMMIHLIEEIIKQSNVASDGLGQGSMELINIASAPSSGTSTVPHQCWATFDRYMAQDETEEEILAPIYKAIRILSQEDNTFQAEVGIVESGLECYTGQYLHAKRFFSQWEISREHELVRNSLEGLCKAGFRPELSSYKICTNGNCSAGITNIPTIGFGPGREQEMHVADENIKLTQLFAAAIGYQAIACQFLFNK
jgi:putative selenium metabolism hydrolase